MNWSIVMNVLFVVLIIAAIVLGVLYYFGRKLEKRQVEAQATIDAAKQAEFERLRRPQNKDD